MKFRDRSNTVGTKELILVKHPGENPTESLRVNKGKYASLCNSEVPRTRRVDGLHELWHPA